MKSELVEIKFTFDELIFRIREFIRLKIAGGQYTERSLARVLRVSQPQLHNVLKGVRRLTPEFADRALGCFNISILDLISAEELLAFLDNRSSDGTEPAAQRKPPSSSGTIRARNDRVAWREAIEEAEG